VALSTRQRRLEPADDVVARTKAIITYLRPRLWWIENPRWGLLRDRPVVRDMEYIDADYCQFSHGGFQKPTRFWCCKDIAKLPSVVCDNTTCTNLEDDVVPGRQRTHKMAIACRGRRAPRRDEVLKIPEALVDYLCGSQKQLEEKSGDPKPVDGWQRVERKCRKGQVREVYVLPWHLQTGSVPFTIGKVEERGRKRQLLMEVEAAIHGEKKTIKVLFDTGVQANLVRRDLFPLDCFKPARQPLALSTVSGEMLPGGRQEIKLQMKFTAETEDGQPVQQGWKIGAVLHDADIWCDAILGYE